MNSVRGYAEPVASRFGGTNLCLEYGHTRNGVPVDRRHSEAATMQSRARQAE